MKSFDRVARAVVAIGVTIAPAASAVIGSPLGTNRAVAEGASMTLIKQDLALAPDAPLTVTLLPSVPVNPTDTILVASYRRIDDRAGLAEAMTGSYGRVVDSVTLRPDDPNVFSRSNDGIVTITVASETLTNSPGAVQFPRSGLYPVTIDIQDAGGALVGGLLTFVDRSAAPGDAQGARRALGTLAVSVVASVTAAPMLPDSDTALPSAVVEQINGLTQYPATLPLSLSISPEILGRLDDKTLGDLRAVMARSLVLAQPSIPLDPSAAAAAGQQSLFTRLLRAGEDQVFALGAVRASRAAWIETSPMTADGAAVLRDLGVRLLLISPQTYKAAGNEGGWLQDYTLYSQLRNTRLADGSSLATAVYDPTINRYLTNGALSPELAALYTAADLVAWRDQLDIGAQPLSADNVLLGLPFGGVLDAERVSRVAEMATATGAIRFTDLNELAGSTQVQMIGADPATLSLAPQPVTDLALRAPTIVGLSSRQATISSMIVDDAGRTDGWARTIQVLSSSSITDAQVNQAAARLNALFDTIQSAVVAPGSYTFTMNGLSTTLYPRIVNNSVEKLKVVVQLRASADKMQFPAGDQNVTLSPNGVTEVPVPVEARSNGSFTVTLQIMAPDGLTPVSAPVILTAQVNALTGLAQVLTGGGLLILMTWWVRNLRRSRRQRRSESSMNGHPARSGRPLVPATAAANSVTATAATQTATITAATVTAAATIAALDTGSPARPGPADPGSTNVSD